MSVSLQFEHILINGILIKPSIPQLKCALHFLLMPDVMEHTACAGVAGRAKKAAETAKAGKTNGDFAQRHVVERERMAKQQD